MDGMLSFAGFVTGLLVGLTGVGGGAVMTPLLLLLFGIAPQTAVGTDLWFASLTKLAATRIHGTRGLIDVQVLRRLWAGSLPAAAITLVWLKTWGAGGVRLDLLKVAIAGAVILTAVGIVFQRRLHAMGRAWRLRHAAEFKSAQGPLTVAAGAVLGVLVALTSVGAGALGAVVLAYLYPLRLTPPRLIATDIAHAIPLAMVAGLGHAILGNVDLPLLGNLLLGSLPGVVIGAHLSARLPHGVLRMALAIVLAAVGMKLLAAAL